MLACFAKERASAEPRPPSLQPVMRTDLGGILVDFELWLERSVGGGKCQGCLGIFMSFLSEDVRYVSPALPAALLVLRAHGLYCPGHLLVGGI
jgi:hypothetical protein